MPINNPNTDTAIIILLTHATLLLLAVSAAVTDLKRQSIYNWQTYSAVGLGLGLNFLGSGWPGLAWSCAGLATGFGLLFFFYLSGGFGAGDVKFLAAIGALEGVEFVLWTMVYAALIGGIMAFAVMIWRGVFLDTVKRSLYLMRHPLRAGKELQGSPQIVLPYGLAISIGCCWALLALPLNTGFSIP
jgi:prepilin peptidase CpaA